MGLYVIRGQIHTMFMASLKQYLGFLVLPPKSMKPFTFRDVCYSYNRNVRMFLSLNIKLHNKCVVPLMQPEHWEILFTHI